MTWISLLNRPNAKNVGPVMNKLFLLFLVCSLPAYG